jgi:hypothetical protein
MHPGPFQSLMQATACSAAAKDHRHKKPRAALQAVAAVSLCSISALVLLATSALAQAPAYAQARPGVAAPAVVRAPARPAPAAASASRTSRTCSDFTLRCRSRQPPFPV